MQNRLWDNKEQGKDRDSIIKALGEIVGGYVRNHTVEAGALPGLIQQTFSTLCNLHSAPHPRPAPQPPISIEESITNEYLICFEDMKRLKMLKRHLRTAYGMTPEEYRSKWGLPFNYPMVAPSYALKRSALAKNNGLGIRRGADGSDEEMARAGAA